MNKETTNSSYNGNQQERGGDSSTFSNPLPSIELPKGGGSIKGIEEKFQVNAITGTSSFHIPLPLSPSRSGFTPALGLNYNSGNGNSPFGLGWEVGLPYISRKTEKQLPQYRDEEESDTFIISDSEDLIPLLEKKSGAWVRSVKERNAGGTLFTVASYRPRIESSFSSIERWKNKSTGDTYWRTITRENVQSYYGLTEESRISDPQNPSRVFRWLLCSTHDDKGNISLWKYKKENFANIPSRLNEQHRVGRSTQVYLKKVCYGNRTPYTAGDALPPESDFLFQLVFDYGEHDATWPVPKDVHLEKNSWKSRPDPFSFCRSGFELRTYRRCSRILMFHCFDIPDLPHSPYLVRSLSLFYEDDLLLEGNAHKVPGFSFLTRSRQSGHQWDASANHYSTKNLPDLTLSYQQHAWNSTLETVSSDNAANAPAGINDRQYIWVDLFREGIAGILTEQGGGIYYKSNLGGGDFAPAVLLTSVPSIHSLSSGEVSLQEFAGNSLRYLTGVKNAPKGFFRLTDDNAWDPFTYFSSFPNIDPADPNLRVLDLNGDGMADYLITEERVMRWYEGKGEEGFEVSHTVFKEIDEEKGPAIVFSDPAMTIFLADMNGDGLTDIVRIRNGEICYWPNLGYGRFGAKVNMDNAPFFDHPDLFNPGYLRIADIDGSGTPDIIYVGKNDFRIWMNLNGNEWTPEPEVIAGFPEQNNFTNVSILDFLGSGTACIVCSSSLPADALHPIKFIDLLGSRKPGLLTGYQNNCGKEVSIEYRSSVHFYLEDKKLGRNWITKLPFPVHCIYKVRTEDKISESVFVSTYRYSHGYYDTDEREFRGFARVEQADSEDFSRFSLNVAKNVVEEDLHQPPVRTISWYHTGAFQRREKILHQCGLEYFKNGAFAEYALPEPVIVESLTTGEWQEAMRALKALPLRTETYAADGTPQSIYPFTVTQFSYDLKLLQPRRDNRYASFLILPSETISYNYERNPADPRITHSFVFETDDLGNILKTGAVTYPRLQRPVAPHDIPDKVWEEQNRHYVVYSETKFTNDVIADDTRQLRRLYESKSYEVSGITFSSDFFISKKELYDQVKQAGEILFEEDFGTGKEKRLSAHARTYYYKNDLSGSLPLGVLESLAINYRRLNLIFTKNFITRYFGTRVNDALLAGAHYVHSEGDEHWWAPENLLIYEADPKSNFYQPTGMRDLEGNVSTISFDAYSLLINSTANALLKSMDCVNDYRTLSPVMVTDPNQNRSMVTTDELGLVVASAVMGKEGAGEGDTPEDPTTRMEYDLLNWQNNRKPNYVHSYHREVHGPSNTRWQEVYIYSDGAGNIIMTKLQAEPGKARKWNEVTKEAEEVFASPRWIGNGRIILNNKGNPVKKYDPYFSDTFEYESESALVETGFTPLFYYDAAGRNIRTEYPDGTFARTTFDGWFQKKYERNDTVKDSQWFIDRGSPDPAVILSEPSDPGQRAAWLAAKHHDTPAVVHMDSLGRAFYTIADYGGGKKTATWFEAGPTKKHIRIFDAMGRMIAEYINNISGQAVYGKTAEKGEKWTLGDAMGRIIRMWDNDVSVFRYTYDALNRPVSCFVKDKVKEIVLQHTIYGEIFSDASDRNMIGKTYRSFDQAGALTLKKADFKGNVLEQERHLLKDYENQTDWLVLEGLTSPGAVDAAAGPLLGEGFTFSASYDGLNRVISSTLPDNSVVQPVYNEANLLNALRVKIRGAGDFVTFLENQDYDARGQRQFVKYGNGLTTYYSYEPATLRLTNLLTKKEGTTDEEGFQDLQYTYDPMGNIVHHQDEAQQTHYFQNAVIYPESKFEYDALYQLIKATGRELAGLPGTNIPRSESDLPFISPLPHINDANAVRQYAEVYEYDDCGNILQLQHKAASANWNQYYRYEYQEDPSNPTNRLKSTSKPGDPDGGPYSGTYTYDLHGNMKQMPHLSNMVWNVTDHLSQVSLGGGGKAFYVCNASGIRIRKVIKRNGGKRTERIYLGAVEIYREYQNDVKKLERSTLRVSDNTGVIAQVDTKVQDDDHSDPGNPLDKHLIRYQYSNHLGSAVMETDEKGTVISYEEYHPFGTSAYRSSKSGADLSLKRYRFCGKERDEETGLYYCNSRYYAAWLGRWTSTDPAGFADGMNLYKYCNNNPVKYNDPQGTQSRPTTNPEIISEWNAHPENFTPNGSIVGNGINWNVYYHQVYGNVYQPAGSAEENSVLVWGGPPVISEEVFLARHARSRAPDPPDAGVSSSADGGSSDPDAPDSGVADSSTTDGGTAPDAGAAAPPSASPPPGPAAPPTDDSVGEPGLGESLIPVWGSGRAAINHFQHGNYWRGAFFTALAISDVFLVKALATSVVKLGARGLATLATREGAEIVAREGASEVVHLTTPVAAEGINASQRVGGRWGIFALESSQVPSSALGRFTRTLVPGGLSSEVRIGGEAVAAFRRPPLFGPFSIWRNAVGVRSTVLGSVDLAGQRFIANEIFVNGVFRPATQAEISAFARHQFLLDYGIDGGIYLLEATQAGVKYQEFGGN